MTATLPRYFPVCQAWRRRLIRKVCPRRWWRRPNEPRVRLSPNLALLCSTQWLGLLAFGERKRQLIPTRCWPTNPESRDLPLYALLHRQRYRYVSIGRREPVHTGG